MSAKFAVTADPSANSHEEVKGDATEEFHRKVEKLAPLTDAELERYLQPGLTAREQKRLSTLLWRKNERPLKQKEADELAHLFERIVEASRDRAVAASLRIKRRDATQP